MQRTVRIGVWDRFSQNRKSGARASLEPPAAHLSQILAELKEHDMKPPAQAPEPEPEPDVEQLVAEQRKAAEALLLEAYMLEERVKRDAHATENAEHHTAANERLERARAVEREAQAAADAASAQVASTTAALEEAERQMQYAQHILEGHLVRARECVAEREAAEIEAADAAEAVKASEARRNGAMEDARALAARIAERAAAVNANGAPPVAA
jgi:hypothetical protein